MKALCPTDMPDLDSTERMRRPITSAGKTSEADRRYPQVIVDEIRRIDCIVPFDLGNVPRSVSKHRLIHKGLGIVHDKIGSLKDKGFEHTVLTFTVSRLLRTHELTLPEWVDYHKDGCAMREAAERLEEEAAKVQSAFKEVDRTLGKMVAFFCIGKGEDETRQYVKRMGMLLYQGYRHGIVEIAALAHNPAWAADKLEQYALHNGFLCRNPDELALRIFNGCREQYYSKRLE